MLNVAIAAHFHTPESLLLRRAALFRLPTTELDSAGECAKCKLLAETDNADQQQAGQARHQLSWVEREARPLFKSRVSLARASHKPLNKLVFWLCSCLSDVRVSRRHKRSSNATRWWWRRPLTQYLFRNEEVTRWVRHCTWFASGIRSVIGICNKDADNKWNGIYNKTNTQLFTLLVMGLIKRRFKQRTFVEGNNYKAGIKLVRFDSVSHVAVEIPSTCVWDLTRLQL